MKNSKLIILRGKPTSGKSTAFHNLRKDKRMKDFIFVDFCYIKGMLENLSDEERRNSGKEILFFIMKKNICI